MKFKANTKKFNKAIKRVGGYVNRFAAKDFAYFDTLIIRAHEGFVYIYGADGIGALCAIVGADIIEEGVGYVNTKLMRLVNSIKDEDITLSYKKQVSITTESGFKARLNTKETSFPYEAMEAIVDKPNIAALKIERSKLKDLVTMASVFESGTQTDWVGIKAQEDVVGFTRPDQLGEVENFPLEDTYGGEPCELKLSIKLLKSFIDMGSTDLLNIDVKEEENKHTRTVIYEEGDNSWWGVMLQTV